MMRSGDFSNVYANATDQSNDGTVTQVLPASASDSLRSIILSCYFLGWPVLFAVGIWSGNEAERHFGKVDPGPVVLDEVVGMLITLALLPVNLFGVVVGFLLFRILDVFKPWPSGRFERLPGGLGVMADDGMAAVYGNLAMRALMALAPGWLA